MELLRRNFFDKSQTLRFILEEAGIYMNPAQMESCFSSFLEEAFFESGEPCEEKIIAHAQAMGYHAILNGNLRVCEDVFHLRKVMNTLLNQELSLKGQRTEQISSMLLAHAYGLHHFNLEENSLSYYKKSLRNVQMSPQIRTSLLPPTEREDYSWESASAPWRDEKGRGKNEENLFQVRYFCSSGPVCLYQAQCALAEMDSEVHFLTLHQFLAFLEQYNSYFVGPVILLGQFVEQRENGTFSSLSREALESMDLQAHHERGRKLLAPVIHPNEQTGGCTIDLAPLPWSAARQTFMLPKGHHVMVGEISPQKVDWLAQAEASHSNA